MRLPLIPLSPYIQTSCQYAKVLAQTTQSLSEQQDNANIKSSLENSLHKDKDKLDRLTKSMQAIQSSCLLDFNMYDIAKEIAYINCSLFRLVTLDPAWLCNFDKQSNMLPLLDFHRYLSHAFAHQVIYGDPHNKSVIQLIQLAYILLHVYRDFSGCTAVLSSLHMPQVRRLQSMWAPCPTKLLQVYQELVAMLSPDNHYEAYHQQLRLHTRRFLDMTPSKSHMIAVPFLQAHLTIIQDLVQTRASVEAAPDVVLSSAGQPLLASTVQLLAFCQQFSKMDLEPHAVTRDSNSNKRASSLQSKAIKLSTLPCLDLDTLRSDANVYHWIVSRAYLTQEQLHAESLHVAPLAVGESAEEQGEEEEHDLYWDFFDKPESVAVIKEPPLIQQQQDPVQATVDGLNVVDSAGEPSLSLQPNVGSIDVEPHMDDSKEVIASSTHATDNPSTLEDLVVVLDTSEEQSPVQQDHVAESIHDDQQPSNETFPLPPAPIMVGGNEMEPVLLKDTVPALAFDDGDDDDDDDDIIILTEEDDEEWTGYPLDSTPSQTVQDTEDEYGDDDDEEWTGYPVTSQDEQEEEKEQEEKKEQEEQEQEDEEEEEEEEEVWKGYPTPSSEEDEQQPQPQYEDKVPSRSPELLPQTEAATATKDLQQEHHHHHQLHAIGKAAARRMQYSLSSTDTNRKRLPSPFAPSSST